jgi:thioredoxin 1
MKEENQLIKFYADWCAPCKTINPIIKEIITEKPYLKLININVETNPEIARQYDIRSIPTIIKTDKKGKLITGITGTHNKETIIKTLQL